MWISFAIPVVFMSFFALHNYFPWFPQVVLRSSVDVFRQSIFLTFGLNFLMLGFGYFINTQIGFSLWFFYLLHQLQEGLLCFTTACKTPKPNWAGGLNRAWDTR